MIHTELKTFEHQFRTITELYTLLHFSFTSKLYSTFSQSLKGHMLK